MTTMTNPRTYKLTHNPTMVQGGGVVNGNPPLGFRSVKAERNKFTLIRQP